MTTTPPVDALVRRELAEPRWTVAPSTLTYAVDQATRLVADPLIARAVLEVGLRALGARVSTGPAALDPDARTYDPVLDPQHHTRRLFGATHAARLAGVANPGEVFTLVAHPLTLHDLALEHPVAYPPDTPTRAYGYRVERDPSFPRGRMILRAEVEA